MYLNWQQLPSHTRRMTGFLSAAVFLHGFALYLMYAGGISVYPELPDWMNIKLVAGLDISPQKDEITRPKQAVPKPKPVTSGKTEQVSEELLEPEQQAEAQHFVKADSRPYEHENPKPFYPAAARQRGMQGLVLLGVEVDIRGKVSRVVLKKSSGYRLLDNAAAETVKRWRFIPAKKDHTSVVSVVDVPIRFELKSYR